MKIFDFFLPNNCFSEFFTHLFSQRRTIEGRYIQRIICLAIYSVFTNQKKFSYLRETIPFTISIGIENFIRFFLFFYLAQVPCFISGPYGPVAHSGKIPRMAKFDNFFIFWEKFFSNYFFSLACWGSYVSWAQAGTSILSPTLSSVPNYPISLFSAIFYLPYCSFYLISFLIKKFFLDVCKLCA